MVRKVMTEVFPVDFSDRTETKNELKQNFLSDIIRDHGQKASVGNADRNPANEKSR